MSLVNITLTFANEVNQSAQVGDTVYFCTPFTDGGFNTNIGTDVKKSGTIASVAQKTITVDHDVNVPFPQANDFIFFSKDAKANTSSMLGYFAEVKFKNDSTSSVELFSTSSQVDVSSK